MIEDFWQIAAVGFAAQMVVGVVPTAPFAALVVRVAPPCALMIGVGLLIVFPGLYGLWLTAMNGLPRGYRPHKRRLQIIALGALFALRIGCSSPSVP